MNASKSMGGRRWRLLKRRVYDRDGWRCRVCRHEGYLRVAHIRPRRRYPELKFLLSNLLTICAFCDARHGEDLPAIRHIWYVTLPKRVVSPVSETITPRTPTHPNTL